jgi:hypothetical protein
MNIRFLPALLLAASLFVTGVAVAGDAGPTREPEDTILSTSLFDDFQAGVMAMGRDENGDLVILSVPPRMQEEKIDLFLGPVIVEPQVRFP